ncbi:MAG: amidohydrolase family protein, partial [Bacteroidota bacterium]
MPLLTADAIYTPEGWLEQYVIETDANGKILSLRPMLPRENIPHHKGVLVPGFINAHCHLELSHLSGKISKGLGMVPFILEVVKNRGSFSMEEQVDAINKALQFSYDKGIVGIGDISNNSTTVAPKRQQSVLTHTFIELIGLVPEKADEILENGQKLLEDFDGLSASLTLHAPYSVSVALMEGISQHSPERMSIHLLESEVEVDLFIDKSGPFLNFYGNMGLPLPPSDGKDPASYISQHLPKDQPILWVHLTEASPDQLEWLMTEFPNSYFCLCPRSNLYLHSKLPDLVDFIPFSDRICLGTDSLGSNDDLDVWQEALCLADNFPQLSLHQLVSWLTFQAAQALGMEEVLGDFSPGK